MPQTHRRTLRARLTLIAIALPLAAHGQSPNPEPPPATGATAPTVAAQPDADQAATGAPTTPGAEAETNQAQPSEAERLLGVRKLLESDEAERDRLTAEQTSAEKEFTDASDAFLRIDGRLTEAREQLAAAGSADDRAKLGETISRRTKAWTAAKDRLDLAIRHRKAVREQLGVLTEKAALERQILERLISLPPLPAPPAATGAERPTGATGPTSAAAPSPAPPAPAAPATGQPSLLSILLGAPSPTGAAPARAPDQSAQLDIHLIQAQKDLAARQVALAASEAAVKLLDRGIDLFERDLTTSNDLLTATKNEAAAAAKRIEQLQARLEAKGAGGGGDTGEVRSAQRVQRLEDARRSLEEDRQSVIRQAKRIAESQAMLANLRTLREQAADKVTQAQSAVQSARARVAFLESPFAPHQLMRWVINRGPRVVGMLLVMLLIWWLSHLVGGRLVERLLHHSGRESSPEHASRAETLRRVFESTAGVAIITLGILAALNQAGIDVTVLLGGAAVLGAAVAFGSQNLIKDYFSGFMILVENQYSVGNVVKIGPVTGTVEDITLRMTSIRDLEGVVHFIPHSQVATVSNLTYGWSRILLDINVASSDDVDRAMAAITDTARDLKSDPHFGDDILGDPQMLGVDAISGAAVDIKFLIKTRPLRRWPVKREFLRRLKKHFDAAGIKLA